MGDVTKGPKHAPPGGDRHLGHRAEKRLGQELGQIGRPRELVGRLRVVVRAVVRMAPTVDALGQGLDDLAAAHDGFSFRA